MCGIAGVLDRDRSLRREKIEQAVTPMTEVLSHRGPDSSGLFIDPESGIAFGHRRLAVVDLSPSGHQPMISRNERWVLNFNGEIYNHQSLRGTLEQQGIRLRGSSDTEVLLELVALHGVPAGIKQVNGMFAMALWDMQERALWLVRDRVGEKPLYVAWFGNSFIFGSELKSLKRHPRFKGNVDRNALTAFFRTGYLPASYSIYEGVRKLPPGHVLKVGPSSKEGSFSWEPYWDPGAIMGDSLASPLDPSPSEAVTLFDQALKKSVGMRMVADVPVGAFLSGGVDSSLVTAVMQAQSQKPVRTFTVGFSDRAFDEAPFARAIAEHLGTDHTELYVSPQEAIEVIPHLPTIYDEPFADSSQIPTFLISKLARRDVTVALSGDGGDELFAGYDRFHFHRKIGRHFAHLPKGARARAGRLVASVSPEGWNRLAGQLEGVTGGRSTRWLTADRMRKLVRVLDQDGSQETYISLVSLWQDPQAAVIDGKEVATPLTDPSSWLTSNDLLDSLLWLNFTTYLPDDLLVKVDRAAMAVSLETRLPLLDHDLVEFSWQLPMDLKIKKGHSKWLLKELLGHYVPKELFERPKKGFSVPLGAWLREELRDWAHELLDPSKIQQQGFLNQQVITHLWDRHCAGTLDASQELWAVLMFQAWLENEDVLVSASGR